MEKQQGFIPLQELQALARQKMNGKQPVLQQRPVLTCPPKPDEYNSNENKYEKSNTTISDKNQLLTNSNKMPQSHIYSKYQVRQDSFFYIRFGLTQMDGRIIVVEQDKLNKSIESHWLKFRIWTYQQSCKLKSDSCQLDKYNNYIYNKVKLFRLKLKYLLVDWSFGVKDSNMKLMHVDKILSDQSINLIMNLQPNILFHIQEQLKNILQGNL